MKGANKDAIGSSISYIESRLLENLDIDELAGQIFFSKTHYQRLFHAIVGEPVMEYIKKRRLQQACQTLCQTNASVLEIALEYGYECVTLGATEVYKIIKSSWQAMDSARRILLVGGLTPPIPVKPPVGVC